MERNPFLFFAGQQKEKEEMQLTKQDGRSHKK